VLIVYGPVTLVIAGLLLALYLIVTTRRLATIVGFLLLALSGTAMASFRFLWGRHRLFGFTFTLNEYEVPALIALLLVAGWMLTLVALRQGRRDREL